MTLNSGTKLGRYEVRSKIGEGGMGEVYRARDEKLNREVAIKILSAAFATDRDRLARFEQEAQTAGGLNHPNILVFTRSKPTMAHRTSLLSFLKVKRCANAWAGSHYRNAKRSITHCRRARLGSRS